jgi:hypothetical protein
VKSLRHLLFAVLLLLAQTGVLMHAVSHLRADADTPVSHACALCLAAQGLNAPFASAPPTIALCAADFARSVDAIVPAFSAFAVSPRARAPPAA